MPSRSLKWWLLRLDAPLLGLALVAVAGYLADLHGLWTDLGVRELYSWSAKVVDLIFAADLALKLKAFGRPYLKGPWFVIDLLSSLPVLTFLSRIPATLQSLRFLRMFRVFRLLRILRAVRVTRLVQTESGGEGDDEQMAFHRVVGVAVLVYAALFLAIVFWVRSEAPPGRVTALAGETLPEKFDVEVVTARDEVWRLDLSPAQLFAHADQGEQLLVVGSVMTMLLMIVFARYRISSMWSRQVRALLNLALPAQVADYFMANTGAYEHNVRMPATVIFCDIKGFTSSSETLAIEDLKVHLERVLDVIVEVHIRHDLIIDKFIGDAVMSFRGGNLVLGEPAEHAWRVVRAALDSVAAVSQLKDPYFSQLKIGGASGHSLLIGTFGTSKRLSYTILGDRVNLAARLEASCNALGVGNLFCDLTQSLTQGRSDLVWRRVGHLRVQGKKDIVSAAEAFDRNGSLGWLPTFHEALDSYQGASFSKAAELFAESNRLRSGGDKLSQFYRKECLKLAETGVGPDWQPVVATTK